MKGTDRDEITMNKRPLVSVVMSTYNEENNIRPAIKSMLDQKYENFEFIIVDDGSTDETVDIVQSIDDSRITLLRNKQNRGLPASLNRGAMAAEGDHLASIPRAYSPSNEPAEFNLHADFWGSSIQRDSDRSILAPFMTLAEIIEEHSLEEMTMIVDIEDDKLDLIKNKLALLEERRRQLIIKWHDMKPELRNQIKEFRSAKSNLREPSFKSIDTGGDVDIYKNKQFCAGNI